MPHPRPRSSSAGGQSDMTIGDGGNSEIKQRRQADVFDAVAGRVSYKRFKPEITTSKKLALDGPSIKPDEVLFKRKGAPDRYVEADFYWADQHLSSEQRLPDSDLLKAIHTYTADFYGRGSMEGGTSDGRSLNESALLAFGILLEEAAEQLLGETGDLALVEGWPLSPQHSNPKMSSREGTPARSSMPPHSGSPNRGEEPDSKRRKVHQ